MRDRRQRKSSHGAEGVRLERGKWNGDGGKRRGNGRVGEVRRRKRGDVINKGLRERMIEVQWGRRIGVERERREESG